MKKQRKTFPCDSLFFIIRRFFPMAKLKRTKLELTRRPSARILRNGTGHKKIPLASLVLNACTPRAFLGRSMFIKYNQRAYQVFGYWRRQEASGMVCARVNEKQAPTPDDPFHNRELGLSLVFAIRQLTT